MKLITAAGVRERVTTTYGGRLAATVIPVVIIAALLLAGIAHGLVPVAFVVSGGQFKVSADQLEGTGYSQYAGVATDADGAEQIVTVANIQSATLDDFCQSVAVEMPWGATAFVIRAGSDGHPATATDLQIGMTGLQGDASFEGVRVGVDAAMVGTDAKGDSGDFALDADTVSISDLKQTAWSTQASVIQLNGLSIEVVDGERGCF